MLVLCFVPSALSSLLSFLLGAAFLLVFVCLDLSVFLCAIGWPVIVALLAHIHLFLISPWIVKISMDMYQSFRGYLEQLWSNIMLPLCCKICLYYMYLLCTYTFVWFLFPPKTKWAVTWNFQQCGMCDQQKLRPACAWNFMAVSLLTEHNLEFLRL